MTNLTWPTPSTDGLGVKIYRFDTPQGLVKVTDRPAAYVDPPLRFMVSLYDGPAFIKNAFAETRKAAEAIVLDWATPLADDPVEPLSAST